MNEYNKEVLFTALEIGQWFKLRPDAKETFQKKGVNNYYEGKTLGEVQVLPWTKVFVTEATTADDSPVAHV